MFADKTISNRYSHAVFAVALEHKQLEKMQMDFNKLIKVIQGEKKFLLSAVAPFRIKSKLWEQVFSMHKLNKLTVNLIKLLLKNNRLNLLGNIMENFSLLLEHHNGIQRIVINSAATFDKIKVQKDLEKSLGTKINLVEKINSKLLGGFKLKMGSYIFDCSLRSKMEHLKQQLQKARLN